MTHIRSIMYSPTFRPILGVSAFLLLVRSEFGICDNSFLWVSTKIANISKNTHLAHLRSNHHSYIDISTGSYSYIRIGFSSKSTITSPVATRSHTLRRLPLGAESAEDSASVLNREDASEESSETVQEYDRLVCVYIHRVNIVSFRGFLGGSLTG